MNDPVQPAAFGPYRVIRPLGRGGMGHVYEAVGPDGVHVAVKVFMLDHGQVDLLRRRFDAEAKILRRLGRVRDSGAGAEPDGHPYIVMDLVLNAAGEPETLEDVRRAGVADGARLRAWFDELASALGNLHARGIVHRDVKLENILVDADGHAVLTDFGISRVLDSDLRRDLDLSTTCVTGETTGTRPVLGSYWYLSPALRAGEAASPASDWYALGVAFFRLLTGMWYEPGSKALDLLAPFPAFWRDAIPTLLSGRRPAPVLPPRGGTRRRLAAGLAVLALCGAAVLAAARLARGDGPLQRIRMLDCGGYLLSETPVTRAQWAAVMETPPPADGTADWPVTNIAWDEATNFCARLSARTDLAPRRAYRLPTILEWKAAWRKGQTAPSPTHETTMDPVLRARICAVGWFGQGVDGTIEHADRRNHYARRGEATPVLADTAPSFPPRRINFAPGKDEWLRHAAQAAAPMPVKLKPANRLGLHDMAGNVFEMVAERAYPDVKPLWFNTEYGFLAESHDTPPPCSADDPAATVPLLLGQPFTPGLLEDELWGSHFPKMPNAGFRLAANAP